MAYGPRDKLHGKLLMPAVYWLQRDRRFKLLDELMARETWGRERVRAHQAERLTSLFKLCREHNPFWREKFQQYGVKPEASDPFAELAKLPILTKDELRANWEKLRCTHLTDRDVFIETSSGSTGNPVRVVQTLYYRQLHAAMEYRIRSWMGIHPGEPYLMISGQPASTSRYRRMLKTIRLFFERGFAINAYHIDPDTYAKTLEKAIRFGPVAIFGYASAVVNLAKFTRKNNLSWPTVRCVSTTSEQLFPHDREYLKETFKASVFDRYGSREVMSVSMECPQGSHHIWADLNIVEFAPVEGKADLQAIILTPLDNEAMPLFRYRNGDAAGPVEGACKCGRTTPLMTSVQGRFFNNFVTPDGRIINGIYFLFFFRYTQEFKSFQWHQTSPENIDLYVVPEGRELSGEGRKYLENCCEKIRAECKAPFNIAVKVVNEIPKTPGGKHLYTVSDVLKSVT